jgi:hypothetical protein
MDPLEAAPPTDVDPGAHRASPRTAPIDIDRLTDKVYCLMQAELRRDQARQEGASPLGRR